MANIKVGVVVGSLRKDSFNKVIAKTVADQLPENYEVNFLEIGDLPLYNEDLDTEGNVPAEWTRFRNEVNESDAFIFATPEYNRTMSAAMKNAIDVASRPYGQNAWDGKPGLVTTASIGAISGALANHNLRQALLFVNVPVVQQPEVYIAQAQNLIEDGTCTNEATVEFLGTAANAFVGLVEKYVNK